MLQGSAEGPPQHFAGEVCKVYRGLLRRFTTEECYSDMLQRLAAEDFSFFFAVLANALCESFTSSNLRGGVTLRTHQLGQHDEPALPVSFLQIEPTFRPEFTTIAPLGEGYDLGIRARSVNLAET